MAGKIKNVDTKSDPIYSKSQQVKISGENYGININLIGTEQENNNLNNDGTDTIVIKMTDLILTPSAYPIVTVSKKVGKDIGNYILEEIKKCTNRKTGTLRVFSSDPNPDVEVSLYCLRGVSDKQVLATNGLMDINNIEKLKSKVEGIVHLCINTINGQLSIEENADVHPESLESKEENADVHPESQEENAGVHQ